MSRLSIDLTTEQHQQIKAMAILQGKTIKNFILEKIFPHSVNSNIDENTVWREFENFILDRIKKSEISNGISDKDFIKSRDDFMRSRFPD